MPVVTAITLGMENQIKPASRNPHTPCTGLAAMRDCHDAWSQYVTADDTKISMIPYRKAPHDLYNIQTI